MKPFLHGLPFSGIQKFASLLWFIFMMGGFLYNFLVNVETINQNLMYPTFNLWLNWFSCFLFLAFGLCVLRDTWLMKDKVGLVVLENEIQLHFLNWTEKTISYRDIDKITISKIFFKPTCWVHIQTAQGEKLSVPIRRPDEFLNALPENLKSKSESDNVLLNFSIGMVLLFICHGLLFEEWLHSTVLQMFLLVATFVTVNWLVFFKKAFSSRKLMRREFEIGLLFVIPALYLNTFNAVPLNEIDRLFYGQLKKIEDRNLTTSIADKIELCEHIKTNYLNLKPDMLKNLEKVCSAQVLALSQESVSARNKAFNWAYSEYVRKPDQNQIITLACMYAETDQKDFGLQLAAKHNLPALQAQLKNNGRCSFKSNRQIASAEN